MSLPGAAALRDAVNRGELRAVDAIESALARTDPLIGAEGVGAFLSVQAEAARVEAAAVDARLEAGARPALAGVPVALSDELGDAGQPWTAACSSLRGQRAPATTPAVARLRDAGAIVLGRTNLDALGQGASTEASGFHTTVNPWDIDRVPGGRGGAAAAVAVGAVPVALGSDVAGGLRQAAAWCGVAALRPSPVPGGSTGVLSLAPRFTEVGAIARTVRDLALVAPALWGQGPRAADASTERPVNGAEGIVIGIIMETMGRAAAPPVKARINDALAALEAQGARLRPVSAPALLHAGRGLGDLLAVEALTHVSDPGMPPAGGEPTLDRVLARGRALHDGEAGRGRLDDSLALAEGLRNALRALFDRVDLIATPTTTVVAFRFGEHADDPDAAWQTLTLTAGPSLAGLPALSVPVGLADLGLGDHMPAGLQLIGTPDADRLLLDLGVRLQSALGPLPDPPKPRW